MKAPLLIVLLVSPLFCKSFDHSTRVYGLGYAQKFEFGSTSGCNTMKYNEGSPSLKRFLRFHGGIFYACLTDDIVVGLKTFGAFSKAKNDSGFSLLGGAIGGFFAQYHWKIRNGGSVYVGTTLSCGFFTYSSQTFRKTGVFGLTDNFFLEPAIGGTINVTRGFLLNAECSKFLFTAMGNTYGKNGEKTIRIIPRGTMLAAGLLWGIPLYR